MKPRETELDLSTLGLHGGEEFEDAKLGGSLHPSSAPSISFRECGFDRAALIGATLHKVHLAHTEAVECDFSGTRLTEGKVENATFEKCRLTGILFTESILTDCAFRNCTLNFGLFRMAKLNRVAFVDCVFTEADFFEATLKKVSFEKCSFEGTDFSRARSSEVDFRRSSLAGIRGFSGLRGAIMTSDQIMGLAFPLAAEMGIGIQDE